MGEMQDKVVAAIKDAAKEVGLDCVVNYDYANTGNMVFQRGFDTLFTCAFDFQPRNAHFQFYPPGVKPAMCIGFKHEKCIERIWLSYEDMSADIRKLLDFVKARGRVAA